MEWIKKEGNFMIQESLAREVSDRICFLDEGKLIEDAPPEVFFSTPKSERAKAFLDKVL